MPNAGRTCNGISLQARTHAADPRLRVDGLVGLQRVLTPADVAGLPHQPYLGSLSCIEGGNVPQTDWSGVRLIDLVELAQPHPDARFVRVSAGPYGVPVSLENAERVLLSDRLGGAALTVEQGGPWRLVVPGERYFTSVKWVDRIEVTLQQPDDSATRIAIARARARERAR